MAVRKRSISVSKLVSVFLAVLCCPFIYGQDLHFIYIKAEKQIPFYVKTGLKTYESSGNGYLVIDGLVPSDYNITISLKNSPLPEWSFPVSVDKKDMAFTLKTKGETALLAMLGENREIAGLKVKPAEIHTVKQEKLPGTLSSDRFSLLLADVVDDPTIRLQPVIIKKEEPVLATSDAAPEKTGTAVAYENTASKAETLPPSVKQTLEDSRKKDASVAGTTKPAEERKMEKKDTTLSVVKTEKPVSPESAAANKSTPPETLPPSVKETLAETKKKEPSPPVTTKPAEENKIPAEKKDSARSIAKADTKVPAATTNDNKQPVVKAAGEKKMIETTPEQAKTTQAENKTTIKETAAAKPVPPEISAKDSGEATETSVARVDTKKEITTPDIVSGTEKSSISESTIKEEERPSVLREVVKNIKKGRKTEEPAATPNKFPLSTSIKRTLQKQTANGTELIYVDEETPGNRETIRILIPPEN